MQAAISGCLKFKFDLSESMNPRGAVQPSEILTSAQLTFLLILLLQQVSEILHAGTLDF